MIDAVRNEVWNYFKNDLAPLIRKGVNIEETANKLLGGKYVCVVKKYGDSTRVSANLKSNGIIYFMAETLEGKQDYQFKEPSYNWRS
jgi:hypothetical protein